MNKTKIKFAYEDLCLVSVPSPIACYEEFLGTTKKIAEEHYKEEVRQDAIMEVAVLSLDKTRFVLLREFDEKRVRQTKDYVRENDFHEVMIISVDKEIQRPEKTGFKHKITLTPDEKKNGVPYEKLFEYNKKFLQGQFANFLRDYNLEKQNARKQEELALSREVYQSIFD